MPEVILPCPACGSTDCECLVCTINADESQTIHFHMACNKCFTSGPIADDAESAKKLWNTLPRALRWTHEPPKVAGWYYQRFWFDDHWGEPDILTINDFSIGKISQSDDKQFAGPIAPPID